MCFSSRLKSTISFTLSFRVDHLPGGTCLISHKFHIYIRKRTYPLTSRMPECYVITLKGSELRTAIQTTNNRLFNYQISMKSQWSANAKFHFQLITRYLFVVSFLYFSLRISPLFIHMSLRTRFCQGIRKPSSKLKRHQRNLHISTVLPTINGHKQAL